MFIHYVNKPQAHHNLHYEKFQDGTVKCIEDEIPFEVPEGWEWTRIFSITNELPYGTSKKSATSGKVIVLRMGNIQNGEVDYSDLVYSSDESDIDKYKLIEGDLLFNRTNSSEWVGKTSIYRGDYPAIYAGYIIRLRTPLNSEYLNAVMNSSFAYHYCRMVKTDGVNQSNINAKKLGSFIIPVPPINEQYNIAKKLTLAIPYINSITIYNADIKNTINYTKHKILDLAIRGELIPQNPNDEPASVLIERIRKEKEKLIKQGKLKRDKKESIIYKGDDNSYYEKFINESSKDITGILPFEIPNNWSWCRLSNISSITMGTSPKGTSLTSEPNHTEFHQGKIFFSDKYLRIGNQFTSEITKMAPSDSILLCVRATVGEVNITQREICIGRGLASIKPLYEIETEFLFYWIKAFKYALEAKATGTTFIAVTTDVVKDLLLPVPPIDEQVRILALLKSYYNLIEKIEASLR